MTIQNNNIDLIFIGASTGGPQALRHILSNLASDFGCAIVVTQHMPNSFIPNFVKQLNRDCVLDVVQAKDGEVLKKGKVYVSAGNESVAVARVAGCLKVAYRACEKTVGFCPSVDVLFESVKKLRNINVLGIVLTGIGDDGAFGAAELKSKGAEVWAQEEEGCVAFGMPKAAIERGVVDRVLSLDGMRLELGRW